MKEKRFSLFHCEFRLNVCELFDLMARSKLKRCFVHHRNLHRSNEPQGNGTSLFELIRRQDCSDFRKSKDSKFLRKFELRKIRPKKKERIFQSEKSFAGFRLCFVFFRSRKQSKCSKFPKLFDRCCKNSNNRFLHFP